jgi:hypothetical protein
VAVVRYLVDDVETAIAFYTDRLGLAWEHPMGPLSRSAGDPLLWLSGPQSSAATHARRASAPDAAGKNRTCARGLGNRCSPSELHD